MVARATATSGGARGVGGGGGGPDDVLESRAELLAAEGAVLHGVAAVLLDVDHEHGRRHAEDLRRHREPPLAPALGALQPHPARAALGHAHGPAGRQPFQPRDHAAGGLPRREPHGAPARLPPRRRLLLEQRRQVEARGKGYQVERVQRLGRLVLVVSVAVAVPARGRWWRGLQGGARNGRLLEPRRLDQARHCDAAAGLRVEQSADQLPGVPGYPRRAEEVAALHLAVHGHEVLVLERQGADEEHVEDDAAGPEVGLGAVVAAPAEDLGRHVRRRAARGVEEPVGAGVAGERAEPKISHLEVPGLVEEQVLGLEVAVVHPAAVAEVDGGDELAEVAPGDVLPEPARAGDPGEELAAADQLQGQVDLGPRGHHLVELHDVGVGHHLHHRDLTLHLLRHAGALHLVLGHHFDRHAAARAQVARRVHPPEVAVAKHAAQLVPPLQHVILLLLLRRRRRSRILHC
ncbi:hypothetical protein BRADI_4g30393v3 [Brachypodium distachyon]|uniref:Uncharacterized protein n=1 Tax=Brachypodium distachyon TaxID=15368 RepID=A0A2K2CRD0_BRADI|nr:hypothetical protein BRADI_4g30393v3 [Brachypodium distachyon]PNT64585.1 hypothetical protein BRADI_4g30393v3 [Brachypodium distachyon]PNT64586.1 hypothetical protein BRADI_4g30393v3 [Brachypodium distachyon]